MTVQTASRPTLWQIDISHYSEKVRWALEYKGVDHIRRTPLPGTHIPIALVLTRGAQPTVPVLTIDGRAIGDSTAIIAALEELYPEPPLYPEDPAERRAGPRAGGVLRRAAGAARAAAPLLRADPGARPLRRGRRRRRAGAARQGEAGWSAPTPAPTPASAGAPTATPTPNGRARRSSPRWTGSRPSWSRATASTWSATASASPTSPPPRSSTRSSCPRRVRSPPDSPLGRRASTTSASRSATAPAVAGSKETFRRHRKPAQPAPAGCRRPPQPPIGARGLAPQKTTVPSMPMMWTRMMLTTIDCAVAVPTPTGPPEAV